jgi:hypothetical protein
VTAQVSVPSFFLYCEDDTVGLDLQTRCDVTLGQLAPEGGLVVTLTSNNAGLLTLSGSATTEGVKSIPVTVAAGGNSASFYAQGRATLGAPTITAEAGGFTSRTISIALAPSGIILAGPFGIGFPFFNATAGGAPVTLTVYTARLNQGTNSYASVQALRGGMAVTASHTNSNPDKGTVTPATVVINGGSNSAQWTFNPLASGNTTITLGKPPNFGLSTNNKSLTAMVAP